MFLNFKLKLSHFKLFYCLTSKQWFWKPYQYMTIIWRYVPLSSHSYISCKSFQPLLIFFYKGSDSAEYSCMVTSTSRVEKLVNWSSYCFKNIVFRNVHSNHKHGNENHGDGEMTMILGRFEFTRTISSARDKRSCQEESNA